MSSLQLLGLVSLVVAVVSSFLCAYRLRNWRHPVLLVAVVSAMVMPRIVLIDDFEPPRTDHHFDVGTLIEERYKGLRNGEEKSDRSTTIESHAGI